MKNLWKLLAINLLVWLCGAATAVADKPIDTDARFPELDAMTNEQLLTSVPLGKQAQLIRDFQVKIAQKLISDYKGADGCNVETFRDKEVLIVSIPASQLFAPNDTVLAPGAEKFLNPLARYIPAKRGKDDLYRVLLVMHTDNTGSPSYTDELSLARVEAVFDYLDDMPGVDTRYVFPTAAGASDPIRPNNTAQGRAANRRLEVYLIPGKRLLEAAKTGRIAVAF